MSLIRNLLYILTLFCNLNCQFKNDSDKSIAIRYDFDKGFLVDTLPLTTNKEIFSKTIDSIETKIADLTSFDDVFLSKEFINLYEHPRLYINNVITYLADRSKTKQKRIIALLTMQRKDLDNNLNFQYACNYLYKRRLMDEHMMFRILFPVDLENRDIIKHYPSVQVKKVLIDIQQNDLTSPEFRKTIADILSGESYQEQKEFLAEQL